MADFGRLASTNPPRTATRTNSSSGPIIAKAVDRWVGPSSFLLARDGSGRAYGTTFAYGRALSTRAAEFRAPPRGFRRAGKFSPLGTFRTGTLGRTGVYGAVGLGGTHKLVYSAAYLFGETSVSSDNRAILRLEYEFF